MYEIGSFLCIIAFFIPWGIEMIKEARQKKEVVKNE